MDPDEGCSGRRVDGGAVEVAGSSRDDAAYKETDDNGCGFHDGGAKTFADDDGDEDGETEADELSAAPGESVWCVDIGAELEETGFRSVLAVAAASSPVLESGLDEFDSNEHDGWTGD